MGAGSRNYLHPLTPMHIVFYSPQTLPSIGGLQYVVHYWAEALCSLGHTITIITETPETPANDTPLRLRASACQKKPPGKNNTPGKNNCQILRNVSFAQQVRAMRAADKVLLFNVSLKGLPAILLSGTPIYITHHTALWYPDGPRPFRQRLKQWVANHLAKCNCACSNYIASLYKKCRVIHSPYRADIFVPGTEVRKPGSILFAGRLVSDKGADILIEAFARLLQEGLNICLTIIGDGPDREKLEQLAMKPGLWAGVATSHSSGGEEGASNESEPQRGDSSQPGLQASAFAGTHVVAENVSPNAYKLSINQRINRSAITFTGPLSQPHLAYQMQTHQIMVVPSRMEPMGMVIAEGLACGCHMVVSNQGGMPEVGGKFCRYFESGNVDSLVEALSMELTNPLPVDANLLQEHLVKFTIEHTTQQLEKWLEG